jgi:hypothetical protein
MFAGDNRMLGTDSQFMGIGRTGIDWLKAATGRTASAGEVAEYWSKNVLFGVARPLLLAFISNNGGGIANFLYNAWLRTEPYYLPNEKKYQAEYLAGSNAIEEKMRGSVKTWQIPADALQRYQAAYNEFSSKNPTATFSKKVSDFYTPAQKQARLDWEAANKNPIAVKQQLYDALRKELDAKYPIQTRYIKPADSRSQQKYRDIELMWFWKLGGSPDDLNEAVKEGNGKSPRGKDANYMIMKAAKGQLGVKDIGLIVSGLVSAGAGDKFGLGDDGTFVIGLNGTKKGIGFIDWAAISANIIPITESIVGLVGLLASLGIINIGAEATDDGSGDGGSGQPEGGSGGGSGGGGGNDDEEGGDNTNMLLILGAVAVGGFLLLNK